MHKHTQTCVLHPKRYEESPSPEMVACTMCWASEVFDCHLWSDVPKTLANDEMSTLRLSPESQDAWKVGMPEKDRSARLRKTASSEPGLRISELSAEPF